MLAGSGGATGMVVDAGGAGQPVEPPSYVPPAAPTITGAVCERDGDDLVRDLFCAGTPLQIESLADLQRAMAIDPLRNEVDRNVVVSGHTTALSARNVSAANPRVIFVQREHPGEGREMFAVAFVRGEQTVELVVHDRPSGELRFFLITYRQACNYQPAGCSPGDLLTLEAESGWREVTLLEEEDLKNTALDCRQCHQPGGPGTPKLLRMQERARPWTHWFDFTTDGGRALIADYLAMKGDEPLAGVTAARMQQAIAAPLVGLVSHESQEEQPNPFDSPRIETEVKASAPAQPFDNSIPGQSAAWRAAYEVAKRGVAIAVPYHDVKVTDPAKLAAATAAYRSYLAGETTADELPDFRDIYPDDAMLKAELGLTTEPGLDAGGVLRQACLQCHNTRLDNTISRARFIADFSMLDREQRDRAIERLLLPPEDPRAMPPAHHRALTAEGRQRLIDALR
jgi:hypothetical protein